MSDVPQRFLLLKTGEHEWLIHDQNHGQADARHVVARLDERDEGDVDVLWFRQVPFANTYPSAVEALRDIRTWVGQPASEAPMRIPRRPPRHSRRALL